MGDGWNGVIDRVAIQILRRMTWYSRWEKGGLMMGFRRITCMRKRTHIVHAYPREQLGSKEMKRIEKTSGSRSFLSNVGPSQGSRECQSIPSNMVRRQAARGDGLDLIMSPSHISTKRHRLLYRHLRQSLCILVDEYYTIAANGRTDVREILQGETWLPIALITWRQRKRIWFKPGDSAGRYHGCYSSLLNGSSAGHHPQSSIPPPIPAPCGQK